MVVVAAVVAATAADPLSRPCETSSPRRTLTTSSTRPNNGPLPYVHSIRNT